MNKKWISIVCGGLIGVMHTSLYADPSPQTDGLLYQIPRLVDATPTLLPPESDQALVHPTDQTENATWADQKQKQVRHWADRTAQKMDDWFGDTDPNHPASATLRIILDQSWDKHHGYEIEPRIRGKIELPTLERRFSVVFGDDSLDNELENNVAITSEYPATTNDKRYDSKQSRENNGSIGLRWSDFSKRLPFETDLDLGIRSGDDIYLRLKAKKEWQLENDFKLYAEQIYRYGIDSENYFRTNIDLTHQRSQQALLANQFSLVFADQQTEDMTWQNFSFRQHQFFQGNRFNYGIHTSGYYDDSKLKLNSWGPFISWRQPLWREWFYVQGDLNYLNNDQENYDHTLGTLLRLEAIF